MGIKGLLKELSGTQERIRGLDQLRRRLGGRVAGIDGHSWLHRSAHIYGDRIALDEEGGFQAFVSAFMSMVSLLLDAKIMPLVVFDGMDLPAKRDTKARRLT